MSKKTFSVDDTLYRAQAKKLVKQLKLDETKFVKEQAALYCVLMSKVTPPFIGGKFPELKGAASYQGGKAKATEEAGKRAIKKDLGNIFRIREKGYLQFLHETTGRLSNIKQILRTKKGRPYVIDVDEINYTSVAKALAFHRRKRLSTGRTPTYKGDKGIGRWKSRDVMWVTQEIWSAVFQKLSDNVGLSKAAFASAAVKLGAKKKPPRYIKKHLSKVGTLVSVQTTPKTVVSITASAPGLNHALRVESKVRNFRMVAMVKRLKHIVRTEAKKAGFKTR